MAYKIGQKININPMVVEFISHLKNNKMLAESDCDILKTMAETLIIQGVMCNYEGNTQERENNSNNIVSHFDDIISEGKLMATCNDFVDEMINNSKEGYQEGYMKGLKFALTKIKHKLSCQ